MKSKPHSQRKFDSTESDRKFMAGTLAVVISGALGTTAYAADEATVEPETQQSSTSISLDTMTIEDEISPQTNPYAKPGSPYLANRSGDARRTKELHETPATISVLTKEVIAESGRSDLKEILDAQPGITLGTGENGNAFGDRYVIRGHEARSDTFVDGLRDPGITVRESFAVEQLEVTKGPSSTFAGRGATGGAVNAVTKRASSDFNFNKAELGVGTDSKHRLTLDSNFTFGDFSAARINLLHAEENVPDREPADRARKGLAASVMTEPTDNLEIAFDYYHFEGDDTPDLGTWIPTLEDGTRGDPVDDVPVYLQDEDFLESTVDTATLRLGYQVSPQTRVVNLLRYGVSENGYLATGANGTTGYATEEDATNETNGFASATISTHQGWQEVDYFGNQLNVLFDREFGGKEHDMIVGFSYSQQTVLNGTYDNEAQGDSNCFSSGRRGVGEAYCIYDANGNEVGDLQNLLDRDVSKGDWDSDWNVDTVSLAFMDTVQWNDTFQVFGGLRYDYYDYSTIASFDADGDGEREPTEFADTDGIWNGHLGAGWNVRENGYVYATVSTASNINGGESDVGTSCGYGGLCVETADELGDPETSTSIEIGAKWQLMNDRLVATGALFQLTKSDVFESATDDSYSTLGTLNTGENKVSGIELGLTGNITPKLSVMAGIAIMKAEVTESNDAENIGKTLANFADQSASIQLRYAPNRSLAFGGVVTYEGERFTGQPDTAANEEMAIPAYTTLDLFASYKVDNKTKLSLNVGNATDEDYYLAAYRSGAFTYIGDAMNATVKVEYEF